MENNPQVSVIISTYNRLDLLEKSIQSILLQSLQNFEVIIVDDCSSDIIFYQVRNLKSLDERIIVLRTTQNSGNNVAKNLGITKANGKFIAILDDDDIAVPHRLETQIAVFKNNPKIGVVGSQIKNLTSKGISPIAYPNKLITKKFPMPGEKIFHDIYLGKYNIPNSSLMVRTSIIKKWGYPATRENGGDMTMLLKIAAHGTWFDMVSEPLVYFRRGDGHRQMTSRADVINRGRLNRNRFMQEWLNKEGIRKFSHLHVKAIKNTETRFYLESTQGKNVFGIALLLVKALKKNPIFTLYKVFSMFPQSIQKKLNWYFRF